MEAIASSKSFPDRVKVRVPTSVGLAGTGVCWGNVDGLKGFYDDTYVSHHVYIVSKVSLYVHMISLEDTGQLRALMAHPC